jgi:hypothetical protein
VFRISIMKQLVIPALAASMLLISGCSKTSVPSLAAPVPDTDWGVVEVVSGVPKRLQVEGKDCTLTATPLADGNLAVSIEGDFGVTGKDSPDGVPPGMPIHTTLKTTLPANVECLFSVAQRPVRATLKLQTP